MVSRCFYGISPGDYPERKFEKIVVFSGGIIRAATR